MELSLYRSSGSRESSSRASLRSSLREQAQRCDRSARSACNVAPLPSNPRRAPMPDRPTRSPLVAPVHTRRLPPPLRTGATVYFADYDRRTWAVHEADCGHLADARAPRCLLFESDAVVRRVFFFPPEWAALSTEELIALARRR
jgi:hypothetical protein